jgi:predicted glutamine amidotransferase
MQTKHRPVTLDGYGLAGFNPTTGKWQVYKSHRSPEEDPNSEDIAGIFAEHPLIIGHSRHVRSDFANVKTQHAKCENSHPFYYRNHVFLHNGIFYDSHTPTMQKWFQANILPEIWGNLKGHTDTERIFYLLVSIIKRREWIYKDIDMLKNRGCKPPSKYQELHDSVQEWMKLLKSKFNRLLANIVYADKECSIVGRFEKNATEKEKKNNPLYLSGNGKRLLFMTEHFDEKSVLLKFGEFYVIQNATGEYVRYNERMDLDLSSGSA